MIIQLRLQNKYFIILIQVGFAKGGSGCKYNLRATQVRLLTLQRRFSVRCCTFEFSLNVCTEFAEFSDNIFVKKGLFELTTSCVRDQDVITMPARHK